MTHRRVSNRPRSRRFVRQAVLTSPAILALMAFDRPASAQLFWDINGAAAGAIDTAAAAGTWNATNTNWSTDSDGTVATQAWVAGSQAVFSAGTNATDAFTVTVSGTQETNRVTMEEGTLTFSGGTLNFTGATPTIINRGGAGTNSVPIQVTINSTLSGSGGLTFDLLADGVTRYNVSGDNSGLTGIITLGRGTGVTVGLPSNFVEIIPTHDNALGAPGAANAIVFSTPGVDGNYSRIRLTGDRNINKQITIVGGGDANGQNGYGNILNASGTNTWSGDILTASGTAGSNATGATIASNSGTLVVTGVIKDGTGGGANGYWTKMGNGTVALENTNTFSNFIRHNGGILELRADGALGTAGTPGEVSANTIITGHESGAVPIVAFRAPASSPGGFNYSTYEMLDFAGARAPTTAELVGPGVDNYGGHNTFAGEIRLGQIKAVNTGMGNVLGAVAGTSLELSGKIWAAQDATARIITKTGGGELIISAANTAADAPVTGRPRFGLDAGTFNLSEGTLTFRGAGELTGGIELQLQPRTTLKLDNAAAAKNNRILPTTALPMYANNVQLLGHATTSTAQTVANASLNAAMSNITVNQPGAGATTTLTLSGALTRTNTATLRPTAMLFGLQNTSSVMNVGNLSVTAPADIPNATVRGGAGGAGTSTIDIVPWLANSALDGSSADFVTANDGAGGAGRVRALAANEYAPLASGNSTLNNTTASGTVNISANTTVNSIKFNDASNVSIASGQTLYVNSGAILGAGASGTISGPGTLAFHQYYPPGAEGVPGALDESASAGITDGVDPDSAVEAVVHVPAGKTLLQASNNVITGAQGLTKSGDGTLRLEGNNTFGHSKFFWYTDGVNVFARDERVRALTINAGEVVFTADSALGHTSSAGVVLDGGTIRGTNGADAARPINLVSTTLNGVGALAGANATYSGVISGGELHVVGPGTVRLTNDSNSYVGGTTVMAGYLQLLDTNPQLTPAAGTLTLDGGHLRADVSQALQRSFVVASTGSTSGLYVAPGATLTYGGAGIISGAGNLAIDGGGTVTIGSQSTQNSYTGKTYINNGTLEYTGVNGLPALPGGVVPDYWVLSNNSTLRFNVTSSTGSDFSSGRRGITINSTGGIIDIPGSNIVANFGGINGSGTLTKQGTGEYRLRSNNSGFSGKWDIQEGLLEMGVASNNALTLGVGTGADFVTIRDGATLRQTTTASTGTMGAAQGVTLAGTNHTIAVANNTILTIPGDITAGAGKNLTKTEAGTLRIKNFRGQNLNVNAGTLGIIANGGNDGTSKLSTVTIDPAAKIDLTNNKMVITGESAGSWNGASYDGVSARVITGQGSKVGGVPQWDGAGGIMTSSASTSNLVNTIAVARAGDVGKTTHGGQAVASDDALLMYTYGGDGNLSGKVDADDYFIIDSNYGSFSATNAALNAGLTFAKGDYNYDGLINGDDYNIIDAAYVGQGAPIAAGMGVGGDGVTAVPEPASLALVSLAALSCLTRRRRR